MGQSIWSAIKAWAFACNELPPSCVALLDKCLTVKQNAARLAALKATSAIYARCKDKGISARQLEYWFHLVSRTALSPGLLTGAMDSFKKIPTAQVSNEPAELISLSVLILHAYNLGQKVDKTLVDRIETCQLFSREKFLVSLTQEGSSRI